MTKKAKLTSTIIVALFIMALVPIAIFATASKNVQVSNQVKYYVEDLEGDFYYAIAGNADDDLNIGYNQTSNIITPAHLFSAEFDETFDFDGEYLVYDSMNNIVEDRSIPVPQTKGLEFDKDHSQITYYFVFINKAVENNVEDDRRVFVKTKAETTLDSNLVTTEWAYILKTTQSAIPSPLDTTGNWTTETTNPAPFVDGIELKAKDNNNNFTYIILKYTLTLSPDVIENETEFSANINLTITLESASQS